MDSINRSLIRFVVFMILCLPCFVHAAAGDLDPAFGGDGKVVNDFSASDSLNALAIQADGKILAVGYVNLSTNTDFALARYNSDGSLDTTFGGDGLVTTDLGFNFDDSAHSVAIQPDGKIIAAGYVNSGSLYSFALARYNPDGTLDSTFDGDGILFTSFPGDGSSAEDVLIQPDGKIVAAGYTFDADFALARYNTDGSLDSTFGRNDRKYTILRRRQPIESSDKHLKVQSII